MTKEQIKGHLGQQQANTPRKEVHPNGDVTYHVEDGMTTTIDDLLKAGCTRMVMERGVTWNFGDERGAVKVEDLTKEQAAEIVERYKRLYNIDVVFRLEKKTGRKKVEGTRHMYTVAEDVHEWIMAHGAGKYLTDTIRVIKSVSFEGVDVERNAAVQMAMDAHCELCQYNDQNGVCVAGRECHEREQIRDKMMKGQKL